MSDEPIDSSETIRVVKLTTGEEIVGILVNDCEKFYTLSFPARIDVHYGKGPNGMTEFVKLSNYAASIKEFTVSIAHTATIFIGEPNDDVKLMYMTYCEYMRQDPKMIISSAGEDSATSNDMHGLEMLNELFSNSDFVEFVNDLIENYEGNVVEDEEDEETEDPFVVEQIEEKEQEIKPKKKKKVKPEGNKLPYNPDAPPNTAESWPDNPNDYLT